MRAGYCAPSISQAEGKMSCQIMAPGWPLQQVNFHHTLTLLFMGKAFSRNIQTNPKTASSVRCDLYNLQKH